MDMQVKDARIAPRISFATRVLVEFDSKKGLTGRTQDVSESGAFIETNFSPKMFEEGTFGLLHMLHIGDCAAMPCEIARITDTGIAVKFVQQCPAGLISQLKKSKPGKVA
ncbi:PilZ domain-containing protein [Magnetococcus sp. PR-3]|uniref:PilZ domain-containing protein n=1 Tax=Magnetococcus sp. PR-3 TaxID=3120355 RepID=UPI002FCE5416